MSYTPDLSGINPDYLVTTYQRTVFKYAQKVLFDIPIFQNSSLQAARLGVIPSILTYGIDYIVYEDDIAYDAMSVCKNIDPTFSGILLNSLTMLVRSDTEFKVQIKFNQLMMDSLDYARINEAREIEVTPALISNMVEEIEYLKQMILDKGNQYSPQSDIVKLALNEYPNGDNDENLVVDEPHDINTLNGNCLICPIYGPFFRDSVVVKKSMSGTILTPGTDFEILNLDIVRTECTSNTSGVYRTIKILLATVGEVKVSYRAYGGVVDITSMRSVQEQVNVIETYLSETSYITPKTLPADPTIISVRNKLQELEGTMRLLLQKGLPSYSDCSTGTAVLKRVVSQDTTPHWWTIASLYRVDGSLDDVLADVFKFRLKSMISGMMFECSVSVNANTNSSERLSVTCNNSIVPVDTLAKYCPKLRIIEMNVGGVYSGILLQLGMKLSTGILQETFDIEDMSGRESCWKLVPFSANSTNAEDTGVLMPNNTFTFSPNDPTARVDESVIPFVEGLNILESSANIPLVLGTWTDRGTTTNFDMVVQDVGNINISKSKSFEITAVVNIGDPNERTIKFILPIELKDDHKHEWQSGLHTFATVDSTYIMIISLWYTVNDVWEIVINTNASNQGTPLNITAIKLLF